MPIHHLLPYHQTCTTTLPIQQWSGDTLNFSTRAIYTQPHGSGWNTAQTVGNMVSSIIGAFVGPAPATFDGKANLLTNGQTIINTTAFHMFIFYLTTYGGTLILPYGIPNGHLRWVCGSSWGFHNTIQHQQQNTPANNTPRAFLKALFLTPKVPRAKRFGKQMNLTDSALIHPGANTIHTYSGQRTVQQNGYVFTNKVGGFYNGPCTISACNKLQLTQCAPKPLNPLPTRTCQPTNLSTYQPQFIPYFRNIFRGYHRHISSLFIA